MSTETAERTESPSLAADQMTRFAKILRGNAERHAAEVDRLMGQLLALSHAASVADRERHRCEQEAADWEAAAARVSA